MLINPGSNWNIHLQQQNRMGVIVLQLKLKLFRVMSIGIYKYNTNSNSNSEDQRLSCSHHGIATVRVHLRQMQHKQWDQANELEPQIHLN